MKRSTLPTSLALLLGLSTALVGCGGSSGSSGGGTAASTAASTSGTAAGVNSGQGPASTTSGSSSGGAGGAIVVGSPTTGAGGGTGTTAPGISAGGGSAGGGSTAPAGSGSSSGGATAPVATGSATTPAPTGPDTEPPRIVLTSPRRGLFTTQTQILVEGTITDRTGVAFFLINGNPVLPGANGMFQELITLQSGTNVIELQASDPLANQVKSALSVVSGSFLPENSNVTNAIAARLNRPAFDAIERIAAQQLGGTNLSAMIMAQNPLYTGSAGVASVDVNATAASFGTPTLDLDPQTGGLNVQVDLPQIDVTVRASGRVLGIPYSLTTQVTADNARVEALAVVNVAQGQVTTQLTNVQVTLTNFRFDINNVPGFLENLARNAVRGLIERQIRDQVETILPREINRAIAGANGPIQQTLMGRPATLHMIPSAVSFDAQGASVLADGNLIVTPPAGLVLPTAPGSLTTPGAAPVHPTAQAFHLSTNDDLLNRIGHAAWRGGLLNFKVDQAMATRARLPAWLTLDASLLTLFFPSLQGRVQGTDPIEIELSSLTPPTFKTQAAPGLLQGSIGDLTLKLYVAPQVGPRQLILEAGLQVSMGVTLNIANGQLQVALNGRPTIKTDVHTTPLAPLPAFAVETLVDFVAPPVLQLVLRSLSGFPIPSVQGVNLRNLDLRRDGPSNDWVTLKGDL